MARTWSSVVTLLVGTLLVGTLCLCGCGSDGGDGGGSGDGGSGDVLDFHVGDTAPDWLRPPDVLEAEDAGPDVASAPDAADPVDAGPDAAAPEDAPEVSDPEDAQADAAEPDVPDPGPCAEVTCEDGEVCVDGGCVVDCSAGCCEEECAEGETRCYPEAPSQLQECGVGAEGCLAWAPPSACPVGGVCEAGSCVAACQSDPACAAAGDTRCASAAAIETCVEVEAGCFKLGPEEPCPGAMICGPTDACECVDACPGSGVAACFDASSVRTCTTTPEGCLVWGAPTICPDGGACEGAGLCQAPCLSDPGCTADGLVQCASAKSVVVCEEIEPGCFGWGEPASCGGTQTCSDGVCAPDCVSDCPALGALGCDASGGERACEEVAAGCLKWGPAAGCAAGQVCVEGAGCVCADTCAPGEVVCADEDLVSACMADGAGCLDWQYVYCGVLEACVDGECFTECASDPGCDLVGETRCASAGTVETCLEVEPGCLQWGAVESCSAQQLCEGGACVCFDTCASAGASVCVGATATSACVADADGCLHWAGSESCPDEWTCTDGTCVVDCEPDAGCTSVGSTQCAPEGGLVQTCEEVLPGCLKWSAGAPCPPHQACAEGGGCACEDSGCAAAGATSCDPGGFLVTCVADEAGCVFPNVTACGAGLVCADGACAGLTSPVVGCGSMTFQVPDAGYGFVQIGGGFNEWQADQTPATLELGVWRATVLVEAPGSWEYKLFIDGQWVLDPLNPATVTAAGGYVNSLVEVPAVDACGEAGGQQCQPDGSLAVCAEVAGCLALVPAEPPCLEVTTYCADAACVGFESPVVTADGVTLTVRDQGYGAVSVAGSFTDPAWDVQLPLAALPGRFEGTLAFADHPGLVPGQHLYKLVTDAEQWFADPANPLSEPDGLGGVNSVLVLDDTSPCTSGCDVEGASQCVSLAEAQTCAATGDGCYDWASAGCEGIAACFVDACVTTPVVDGGDVTFHAVHPGAGTMHVAGSFTDPPWEEGPLSMASAGGDLWSLTVAAVPSGTWHYKLVADLATNPDWYADPRCPASSPDGLGGVNSEFVVP